jgi:tRNA pseudouridine55 synthase
MTKQAERFSKLDKVYEATIRLGATSTTGDPEGEITPTTDPPKVSIKQVESVLASFVGTIDQTPPIYSAIKINGRRAYKLARQGKQPEMPLRKVSIYSIELIDYQFPELKIRVHCSSGTYIRSLAQDIGEQLGTGAYTLALRRLKIGDYLVENAENCY